MKELMDQMYRQEGDSVRVVHNGRVESYSSPQRQMVTEEDEANNRRTRASVTQQTSNPNNQQTTCLTPDQVKQKFDEWLTCFDQCINAIDQTDKAKGDQSWQDVVNYVDQKWEEYAGPKSQ